MKKSIGAALAVAAMVAMPSNGSTQISAPTKFEGVDNTVLEELVAAGRILAKLGVLDAFGHVSVRHPRKPDHFLMSRSVAPAQATIADIMEFNDNGEAVDAGGRKVFLERYIHSESTRSEPM